MKKLLYAAVIATLAAVSGSGYAQSLEGPLEAPDATRGAVAKPGKKTPHEKKAQHDKAKHKKMAHRDTSEARESATVDGSSSKRDLALPNTGTAPADPLSFGMKWNGSNDDARETRTQNYNAGASGTGAEVGMRLHF